jgi:hypothetical protein
LFEVKIGFGEQKKSLKRDEEERTVMEDIRCCSSSNCDEASQATPFTVYRFNYSSFVEMLIININFF